MAYHQQFNAYKQAAQTVGKSRQIVMLYEGIIRFVMQAKAASEENRIEDRFNLLTKASTVIAGLQGSLDFDQSREIATLLYDYYESVDARIHSLHLYGSAEDYEMLLQDLKQMRDVWHGIDTNQSLQDAQLSPLPSSYGGSMSPVSQTHISGVEVTV